MPDDQTLLSCPFCGGSCDPEGWSGYEKDGKTIKHGPACDDCGASAPSVHRWNSRPEIGAPRWRHLARRTLYIEHCRAELQTGAPVTEGAVLVIYRGEDGKFWAREVSEFEDGRFEAVKP